MYVDETIEVNDGVAVGETTGVFVAGGARGID